MCTANHDATCTAVLSYSPSRPEGLTASLVCEHCDEVVRVIGFLRHTVNPILRDLGPQALRAA
jgi:hypothetical protein